jgi:hypothetical protein
MLKSFRRLLSSGADSGASTVFERWAESRGHSFRHVRGSVGCVVEGLQGTQPWRAEWGAAQRDYIGGFELRLIGEMDLPRELMAMVLNRALMEAMEKTVYDCFVDNVQTRIDTDIPAEMRWLVLYTKCTGHDLGRLRERYGAVSSLQPWLQQWLQSPLNDALAATIEAVPADQPVVLTIGRGRLMLRTAMPTPDATGLAMWFSVFEHGLREARRLGTEWRDAAGGALTTQPGAWQHSELTRTTPPAAAGKR